MQPFSDEERKRFGLPTELEVDTLIKQRCSPKVVAVYYYTESYVGTNGLCACTHCGTFDGTTPNNYAVICSDAFSHSASVLAEEDNEEGVIYCR